jgi:hypothetical protein
MDAEVKGKKAKAAERKAMRLARGEIVPNGRPKSPVNQITEYGALFHKLNMEHQEKGLPPLKTAMEVLIEAMQSDLLDLKEKAKIAEKLATFESSRAPIISIEHVQNMMKEEDEDPQEALDDFLQALRKV